ncbi:polysaccharide deacetylase family protein [bacterium]|nr:MAG: polysaccharide deacetylase family protein [bacterium]
MFKRVKKILIFLILAAVLIVLGVISFTVFFDQAVIVRRGTIYRVPSSEKVVALTFDDGPSPDWTPKILDALKEENIKATFFMLGKHVEEYPDVARRVAAEGHEIGNHTYDHHVLFYYKAEELDKEIRDAQAAIYKATGITTKYFRPPKAWLTRDEKKQIKEMGYQTILWSLNSKDWVTFHDKQITAYLLRHIRPGDIILFHDSGGVFYPEGGNRKQTVKTILRLAGKLREKGYRFVTISELLNLREKNGKP